MVTRHGACTEFCPHLRPCRMQMSEMRDVAFLVRMPLQCALTSYYQISRMTCRKTCSRECLDPASWKKLGAHEVLSGQNLCWVFLGRAYLQTSNFVSSLAKSCIEEPKSTFGMICAYTRESGPLDVCMAWAEAWSLLRLGKSCIPCKSYSIISA